MLIISIVRLGWSIWLGRDIADELVVYLRADTLNLGGFLSLR
jgi:hypothetical protein